MDFLALMDKANKNKVKAKKKIDALPSARAPDPTPPKAAPKIPSSSSKNGFQKPTSKTQSSCSKPQSSTSSKLQSSSSKLQSSSSKLQSSSSKLPSSSSESVPLSAIEKYKAKQKQAMIEDEKRKVAERKALIQKRMATHEGKVRENSRIVGRTVITELNTVIIKLLIAYLKQCADEITSISCSLRSMGWQ